jgi:chromosomal replication initiation ATPase DnaA
MSDMSAYSYPGITLTEDRIINQINEVFSLDDREWVNSKCQKPEYVYPRQLLITCLIDFLYYSQRQAGWVCNRDRTTVYHSMKSVKETLMHDRLYGPKVRAVYTLCKNISQDRIHEKR